MRLLTRAASPATPPAGTAGRDVTATQRRGKLWVAMSFVFCPCHLPVTLALLTLLLGGTAAGALLRDNIWLAAVVITSTWALGTWRGLRLLRSPTACALPGARMGVRGQWARIIGR